MEVVTGRCKTDIGIHAHNDSDLAVANTVIAITRGAVQVQGTMNGLGERCGNANLTTIIPLLELKMGLQCLSGGGIRHLTEVSRSIDEIANRLSEDRQPFVGASAFAHKAGVHVDAMMKNPLTYEHIDPELVGNRAPALDLGLCRQEQRRRKSQGLRRGPGQGLARGDGGLELRNELEHEGYSFEDAEASFELLLKKSVGIYRKLFDLIGFRVIIEKRGPGEPPITEATLKIAGGRTTGVYGSRGRRSGARSRQRPPPGAREVLR